MDITLLSLLTAGLITGFSKFSVGGMGLLILPVLMIAFPGTQALGILIPIYIITDLMAIAMYRKDIAWPVLARLLPVGFVGVALGGWLLSEINTEMFTMMLGITIVLIVVLGVWLDHKPAKFMRHPTSAYITGLCAGFVSLIANAAGPLFSLFMMEQRLSKEAYVSTRAWGFLIINLAKVPVLWFLGLVNWQTTLVSLQCLPGLIVGAAIGYQLLRHLKLNQFKWLIRLMATIAAIKLFAFS
ncbi:sulfite exporter TauE/SafE family protein [Motiliproteus sp. MSK22-1]|uniref:sulfite exporter TauE/SafE family protein n=1 Tax=Motiliproteus sp. MSK22-1 TaxID=1897630 RepID=UPI00097814A9|nr:sulfite exporter TauE/SafE family protein [Motiliproteus sp. MSK22-1]OMH32186.1 permease [Motiliproteus sp. MSK22-1]